ncbi:hypothetical protein KGD82_16125 [Nocardiopsis eucommiae]|uniref:Uncharacterized protein n=1 Tax=Nocardiopsis eucommiae TaxID=2831970 RepID=A0A975QJH4_9ACTN|nr:hypothetical protein KGD82_16125 [Nocardiopsis eucommiae]
MTTALEHRTSGLHRYQVYALAASMLALLATLTRTTPELDASTTSASALVWTAMWTTLAVAVALLSWALARAAGLGVRDGFGIAPGGRTPTSGFSASSTT